MSPITKTDLHPFERAGLGKAPFMSDGFSTKTGPITLPNGMQIGAPGQPMGTCAFCGQGISLCCGVRDREGKRFEVGSECINKIFRSDNEKRDPVYAEIRRNILDHKRKQRHDREDRRIQKLVDQIQSTGFDLASIEHPHKWRREHNETCADYFEFVMRCGGRKFQLDSLKFILQIIERRSTN